MYHKAHNTLRKANKKGHKTMSARFLNSPRSRDSLTHIVWDENTCIAYDEIAKEDHSYVATRGERSRNEKSLHQRDDNQEAKKTCNKLYKEYAATAECGNTRIIHPQEHVRQRPNQEFEVHEEDSYRIDSETGWKYCILATRSSSPSSAWCRPSDS